MDHALYENHLTILRSELSVALGCTEPIAIAYAAAKARELLGQMPVKCIVSCSGNIIKNVMGVTVPNSGGLKGITDDDRAEMRRLLDSGMCTCRLIANVATLYIVVELTSGDGHTSLIEIQGTHKNITRAEKDGIPLPTQAADPQEKAHPSGDRSLLSIDNIVEFANEAAIEDIDPVLTRQIECNMAICREGMEHPYGAEVGRIMLLGFDSPSVGLRARAYAAAGSDARMNGCPMPVVINSGSGNQGITVSVP